MIIIPKKWINEPDEDGDGLLEARAESGEVSFPIPIETHNVALDDVTLNTEQNFEFVIEGASEIEKFANEADYESKRKHKTAAEFFVPAGLFSPTGDENYIQTARAIIHGKVIETYDDPTKFGFDADYVIFTMTCLGYEFDVVIPNGISDIENVEVGNIISGIYWIQGWPSED